MEQTLLHYIQQSLTLLGIPDAHTTLEHPADVTHGDYSTNIALVYTQRLKNEGGAKVLAEKIVRCLKYDLKILDQYELGVRDVRVAGAGFINFFIERTVFTSMLSQAILPSWGKNTLYENKKILIEHSSPNLFKPFHIGHLMNNTIGESIVRLAENTSATVITISFPSDISLGVAKALYILLEQYTSEPHRRFSVEELGDAYVQGVARYEQDESIHSRVKEIAEHLYNKIDSPEWKLYEHGKRVNMEYFVSITKSLGSHFDAYIYESEAGVVGKEIVEKHVPTVFTKSEGAVVYIPDESKKLHTAVFINSQGNPTYEAKDIGLLKIKFDTFNPDLSLFVTDAQQVTHFGVVLDAAEHIEKKWSEKSLHRYHGRMSFQGKKMSSRLGGVPLVEEVVDAVVEEVIEKNPDIDKETATTIGVGAIKYIVLKSHAGKNINFDPNTSLSFEGDSGPYLQYTLVRATSLLAKAQAREIYRGLNPTMVDGAEMLEKKIARFPEIVLLAQTQWTPHYLVTYLTELAQCFNSWYGQKKIIDEETSATADRLYIVDAVRNTLSRGLWMLGIDVPKKM